MFGRRYFSGLTDDGRGSTGARWVTSITERLIPHTTTNGKRALQHFSWTQPYNDPDLYYVEEVEGSNRYEAPVTVGAVIVQTGDSYELIQKTGNQHVFVDSSFGIRVTERRDPWGNSTSFVYQDPPQGGGYSALAPESLEANTGLVTITDSRGATYVIAVDQLGYYTSLTDPLGQVYYFVYTTVGATSYLTKVRYPARQVMEPNGTIATRNPEREFTYNTHGLLHQVKDAHGTVVLATTYHPANSGKVESQTDGTGATYTFSEPVTGQTDVLSPNGWKRSYFHNAERQVLEIRQYVANFAGHPARSTNQSLYHSWLFERGGWCNCGPITKITEPDGGTISLVHSSALDLLEVKKQSADLTQTLQWKWTYDLGHRVTSFVPPEGNAAADPVPYTTTIARVQSGTNRITTRTIPARDWRSTPSVWTNVSDGKGRMVERTGPSHDSGGPSFLGKWTYHAQGAGLHLPLEAYVLDGNTVSYSYQWDAAGRAIGVVDHANRQWSCTYDPEGRPLSWTAPSINGGQVYSHEWIYDGNGRLRRLRWKHFADDTTTTGTWVEWFYTYDAAGQTLTCTKQLDSSTPSPTMAVESWTYDQQGNLLTATDADGRTSSATYDERDLPWVLTDGVGTSEQTQKSYEYDNEARLTVILERLDATRQVRFENEYDGLDRLCRYRIKDAATPTVQAGYVEVDYESGSRIQEIRTYGIGTSGARLVDKKTFLYDDFHASPTRQTSFVYDLATGSLLRSVQSDFDYGPSGRPMREYTDSTLIAQYTYLPCGWPQTVTDAHGNGMAMTWDRYGHVLTEENTYVSYSSAPLITTRTFTRDQFGRATTITDSGVSVTSQTHTYVFDSSDNVVRHTGPDGAVQLYEYRYDGVMTREDAVIAGSTVRAKQIQYTPGGLQHVVTDDRNNSVTYVYDGRGRLKQEVYPDGTTWTNLHNDANLLTKITAPSGRTVDFTYDWRGMIAGNVYKDAGGTVKRTDAFELDLGGFIKRVTKTENGVTQYVDMANDSTGRVLIETTVIPGLPTTAVNYQYDSRGRLGVIESPYGYKHLYEYDDRNRVSQVDLNHDTDGFFPVAEYKYLGTGRSVHSRNTADGHAMQVTRDGHGRLTRMLTPTLADFQYGYDAGNRVNREFRALDGKGDAYWYDGLGRLTKTTKDSVDPTAELASGGTGATAHAFRRQFTLDGDSHRTQVVTTPMTGAAETTNYSTHGTRHHYTAIQKVGEAAVSRSFDLDGRLTSHGTRTFSYDAADNLIEVKDNGVTTGAYGFDALGRRVTKTAGGYEYRFVHAGPWMIEDYRRLVGSSTGTWWIKGGYVHGPGIDNVVMMRHRDWVDKDVDQDKVEPQNFFFHGNRMGSVTELTSDTGAVVERYRYDEYGKPTVLSPGGSVLAVPVAGNSFLFTGREYDWETGLYHYRARAYDPSTGTFLQEDPLGMADGLNVVAYVHADPVNLSDPFGTDGIGEMIDGIMNFVSENRDLIADLVMSVLGPLEGILDLISAVVGKDVTGWLKGGMPGKGPEAMGAWSRAWAAASAAVTIAAGALSIIGKLKGILSSLQELVNRARAAAAKAGGTCHGGTGMCFLAGTLVLLAGEVAVPIEQVATGTDVLCELPAATPGMPGAEQVRPVLETSVRDYEGAIVTLVVEQRGRQVRVSGTPEHPFWRVDRHVWVEMGDLEVGAVLDGVGGDVTVVGREVAFARVPVFNFEVDTLHSYRVTELGVLVHNYDIKTRASPGGDGGISEHLIKRDDMGNANSVTHRVTVNGVVVHQHETHLGKHGGARRFPDEWTGTETIR